jgi:hypothetical protein
MSLGAVFVAGTLGLGSCAQRAIEPSPAEETMPVVYEVALHNVRAQPVKVVYLSPDGTLVRTRVTPPWSSEVLTFPVGAAYRLTVKARSLGRVATLQCDVVFDPTNPEGNLIGKAGGSRTCTVEGLVPTVESLYENPF